jgi:hypothetical protein
MSREHSLYDVVLKISFSYIVGTNKRHKTWTWISNPQIKEKLPLESATYLHWNTPKSLNVLTVMCTSIPDDNFRCINIASTILGRNKNWHFIEVAGSYIPANTVHTKQTDFQIFVDINKADIKIYHRWLLLTTIWLQQWSRITNRWWD